MQTPQILASLCLVLTISTVGLLPCNIAMAESQPDQYMGVTDPFGDPANYEFQQDEREDKEFFHLGRYLMLSGNLGMAIFTGGLGNTIAQDAYLGGKLIYFFDKSFAFEVGLGWSTHQDFIGSETTTGYDFEVAMTSITAGFRYYFDVTEAPKAVAVANPYLAFGGGYYLRSAELIQATSAASSIPEPAATSFGGFFGGGVEFNVYRKHILLGLDLRYHLIVFPDEQETYKGLLEEGARSGDYLTPAVTVTYNF